MYTFYKKCPGFSGIAKGTQKWVPFLSAGMAIPDHFFNCSHLVKLLGLTLFLEVGPKKNLRITSEVFYMAINSI